MDFGGGKAREVATCKLGGHLVFFDGHHRASRLCKCNGINSKPAAKVSHRTE